MNIFNNKSSLLIKVIRFIGMMKQTRMWGVGSGGVEVWRAVEDGWSWEARVGVLQVVLGLSFFDWRVIEPHAKNIIYFVLNMFQKTNCTNTFIQRSTLYMWNYNICKYRTLSCLDFHAQKINYFKIMQLFSLE